MVATGSVSGVPWLVIGGVDVLLPDQVTVNAAANVGFFGNAEVGLRLGAAYNF